MESEFYEVGDWEQEEQKINTWNMSERFGTGFIRQIEIRPGMSLLLQEILFNQARKSRICFDFDFLCFHFCITGFNTTHVIGTNKKVVAQTGYNGIAIGRQGLLNLYEYPKNVRNTLITIRLSPAYFRELVYGEEDRLPKFLRQVYEEKTPDFCNFSQSSTASTKAIVEQLFNSSATGIGSRLFLEGQMLQLISTLMDSFRDDSRKNGSQKVHLQPGDIERIHYARELLAGNLTDPPTLSDLAIATGMNRFKLNCGFKQVFGKTAFAQLREIRLERAKQLLMQGEMNVTEASNSVGYSNLSHFAKAFKQQYNICPKTYLQGVSCS